MAEKLGNTQKNKKNLSVEEKAVFVLMAVIGVLGIVFGFKSFPSNLSRPFEIQLASYTGGKFLTLSEQEVAALELQKTTDSDSDGLMDYDELFIYKTSPYLADSDSDGFDDKTEIFSNNNPNCPEGKDCNATNLTVSEETSSTEGNDILSKILGLQSMAGASSTFESVDDIINYFSQMDSAQVRSMLISQGVPKEAVDAMSDKEIMSLLQTALTEAEASGELDSLIIPTETKTENVDSATVFGE